MGRDADTVTTDRRTPGQQGDIAPDYKPKPLGKYKPVVSKITTKFEGASKDMNGKVFHTHAEQKKTSEFNDTLKELKVFASNKYVKHIDYLNITFKDFSEPTVKKPGLGGKKMGELDVYEKTEFEHKVKVYAKESIGLKSTVRSFFNVIVG